MQAQEAEGAGGRMVDVGEEATWVEGPLEAGDVLMLHSLVVHQGRNNETEDRLRLSVDYRYQPRSHPVRADSMLPHNVPLTWDQVYDDWDPADPVKYYWRDYDLNLVSPDYILTAGY